MKKLMTSMVVAASMTGLSVFACGGMTQIDPPSLQLDTQSSDSSVDSSVDELFGLCVLC